VPQDLGDTLLGLELHARQGFQDVIGVQAAEHEVERREYGEGQQHEKHAEDRGSTGIARQISNSTIRWHGLNGPATPKPWLSVPEGWRID